MACRPALGAGVARLTLARASAQPHLIGWALGKNSGFSANSDALIELLADDAVPPLAALLRGYLAALPGDRLEALLGLVEAQPEVAENPERRVRLLLHLPPTALAWNRADQASGRVRDAYWRAMVPRINYAPDDKLLVLTRLKEFERPRTALSLAQFKPEQIDPGRLLDMLSGFAAGQEPDGPLLDQWRLARILKRLDDDDAVDQGALAHMQWALFPILKHGREGTLALTEQLVHNAGLFAQLIDFA